MANGILRTRKERIYVTVNATTDATGYVQPKALIWKDGRIFPIDRVRDFRPAGTISNYSGDCYTVEIKGQERHLYFEQIDPMFSGRHGRWFVESSYVEKV